MVESFHSHRRSYHRRSVEEGSPNMSFPSERPFPKETTYGGAWATTAMGKPYLLSTKRDDGDTRMPYRANTTPPPPQYSSDGYIVEHYPSPRPSISNKSTVTTLTMVGSDEMAATQPSSEDSSSPETPSKRGWRFYAAFGCLCIISLICALDATSLSVALPVRPDA